ncbi:MAG TPA: flagellar biosynthetic protein FliO [Sphingomonadaceae bacterium]|jgi:flagellar protein FliO/FliZ|nr:flagellar biosynthetic protein FliO [Sphingomonadaceae bacterium]
MDFLSILRTLGALATVLGLLAGALWVVRRYDIKLPAQFMGGGGGSTRRLALVERLALDGRRSIALIRRDDEEHLVLIAPEGLLRLDSAGLPSAQAPRRKAKADA